LATRNIKAQNNLGRRFPAVVASLGVRRLSPF